VYFVAVLSVIWWSIRGRGRIVQIHATVRGSMYRKATLVILARVLRRRVLLHVHSGPGDIATFRAGMGWFGLSLTSYAFRHASMVLAVSSASAMALERAFGAAHIVVVPNVAPPGPRQLPPRRGRDAPAAVYLGGFANPVKGGHVLLAALTEMETPQLQLVMAGPGALPARGRELVQNRQGTEWRGWIEGADKEAVLLASDIFVLPSTSEGLPMALLEAMSYGLAIVATEVGGVPDILSDEQEALLVPPDDPEALAAAIARLAADEELRIRIATAARNAAERLGPGGIARRMDALYRQLL
jgi:glycosyltransferase involved in cell wall biosynthesis